MRQIFSNIITIVLITSLSACCSPSIDKYKGTEPSISVKEFYGQPMEGYGIFKNASGDVTKRYYATLVPTWNGNKGTIEEKQWNEEGKLFFEQHWDITVADDQHHFTATATKINGTIIGETEGFAMHMHYILRAPRDNGSEIAVLCEDWTYLQPDGSGINTVKMHKFGLHVGDIIYDLHPVAAGDELHEGYFAQ